MVRRGRLLNVFEPNEDATKTPARYAPGKGERRMPEGPTEERARTRRYERAFVLRVWREEDGTAGTAFRGSIVEFDTGQRLCFSSLRDLHDFLSLRLS
jgi:hypothetical protein